MKKIKIMICLILTLIIIPRVEATSVSVRASASSITKGSNITLTTTVNADAGIYTLQGTLTCTGAGVSQSGDLSITDDINASSTSKTFTLTIKPTTSGTVTCTTSNVRIRELSRDKEYTIDNSSVSITVKEPTVVVKPKKEYSSNNNLKNIEVEGYSITPEFNKDKLEYNVEVPNGTDKVKIITTKEDTSSSVSNDGEINVVEGKNKLEIKVTAENGNVKTYVINVTVKELDPINVKIDNTDFTVIRKEDVLEAPENYEKDSIKINDEEVLCYRNKKTNNVIIGLKDKDGNNKFYSYDEKTKKYSEYINYKIGGIYLEILDMPKDKIPSGYSKVSFKYGDNKIDGYQYINKNVTYAADNSVKGDDFYLLYAMNETTGKKAIYVYDKKENTIQRYNENMVSMYMKRADDYFLYMLISLALTAMLIIALIIILTKKKKQRHKFA